MRPILVVRDITVYRLASGSLALEPVPWRSISDDEVAAVLALVPTERRSPAKHPSANPLHRAHLIPPALP